MLWTLICVPIWGRSEVKNHKAGLKFMDNDTTLTIVSSYLLIMHMFNLFGFAWNVGIVLRQKVTYDDRRWGDNMTIE